MTKKFVLGLLTFSVLTVPFAPASENLFQFQAPDIDGEKLSLRQFEGQVVLVVNTASKCGYTYQYEGLEKVYRQFKDRGFVVLGFPSDDFWQEYNSNEEIKEFCDTKYNVSFRLFDKIDVNGENASPLFVKLTEEAGREIQWNFTKFLINKEGEFVKGFGTQKKPEEIEEHIQAII